MTINSVVDDQATGRTGLPALADELHLLRQGLPRLLEAVMGSRTWQDAFAGRSYWHPNGFAKLVLAQDSRRGQVRLHVWPDPPTTDDIHGHAWSYASIVLTGELSETTYRESPSGSGRQLWRHLYGRIGHRSFEFGDAVPVYLVETAEPVLRGAGDPSGGTAGHIHRFFASQAPAATMLRVGPEVHPRSHVYRPTAEPPQIMTPRPTSRLDVCEWVDFLGRTIAL